MSWPYQVFRELLQMSIEAFCIWNHHEPWQPWHDLGGGAFLTGATAFEEEGLGADTGNGGLRTWAGDMENPE